MVYYAHIYKTRKQLLSNHSSNVKEIAELLGEKIGCKYIAGLSGLLHDMGKYSDKFQDYISGNSNLSRGSVVHSIVGSKFLTDIYNKMHFNTAFKREMTGYVVEIVSNSIAAHHTSLKNMLNLEGISEYKEKIEQDFDYISMNIISNRFYKEMMDDDVTQFIEYFNRAVDEYISFFNKIKEMEGDNLFDRFMVYHPLITKTIYSILLDADRTDTRLFYENKSYVPKEIYNTNKSLFEKYRINLEKELATYKGKEDTYRSTQEAEINRLRQKMSDECKRKGKLETGVYRLAIPTGGGKTLSSLRFALEHAIANNKDRIIYVIPYTTILEQNVSEVRRILKDNDNILEHHSNVVEEIPFDKESDEYKEIAKLRQIAKDTWNIPIIFTTMVQYLDTIYLNGGRTNRRLHNLTNSILIFDEVQSVPIKSLDMFNESVNYLRLVGNTTSILCTATQPSLQHVQKNIKYMDGDLVSLTDEELEVFNRVNLVNRVDSTGWTTEELKREIIHTFEDTNSILTILNTKQSAIDLYNRLKIEFTLKEDVNIYYLTTNMCAAHRLKVINIMKEKLHNKERVICVSTSLIEAGVNISFSCVYRALIGLDSIAQSAGRCNRSGELGKGNVIIFKHKEENLRAMKEMDDAKQLAGDIMCSTKYKESNILNSKLIELFFRHYYFKKEEIMKYYIEKINTSLYDLLFTFREEFTPNNYPYYHTSAYKLVGDNYKAIDQETLSVIVPYENGKKYIEGIYKEIDMQEELPSSFINEVQRFIVNIHINNEKKLAKYIEEGILIEIRLNAYSKLYILNEDWYDSDIGISL